MIRYFIENRLSAYLALAAFVTAGGLSLWKLPVSLLPSSEYPSLSVIIEYPGISPEKMESLITRPVERILKTVSGIMEMQSVSEEGKTRINITFDDSVNIKIAAVSVREKIELIKDLFPREVQEPVVMRYDPSDRPVMIVSVEIGGLEQSRIREYAERRIKPVLRRIEGISEINIAGGDMNEIHVEADMSLLEARGISIHEIAETVRGGNVSLPCGAVQSERGNLQLYIPARLKNPSEIGALMIRSPDSRGVYIRDVAVISLSPKEKGDLSRYNGRDMVMLYIHKGGGANTLRICREVESLLSSFSDVKTAAVYNQGEYIGASVWNASFSGLWGCFIVVLLLGLVYRKREYVIPVALTMPASIMAVPVFLYLGGRGLNVMSLSGFALGAGMVVSNGIMIMEEIKIRGGGSGIVQCAVDSMKRAVISSTLTNIAVFLPLVALSRKAGASYGDMAFTVVWAMLVSLFAAIVLVPSFYLSLKKNDAVFLRDVLYAPIRSASYDTGSMVRRMERMLKEFFIRALDYSFMNRGRITSGAAGFLFLTIIIFSLLQRDSFSDRGSGEFYVYLEFPTGLSLEATDRGVSAVEKMAKDVNGVKSVSVKVEKWRGTLTVKPESGAGTGDLERMKQFIKTAGDDLLKPFSGFVYISEADEISSREISVHFTGDDSEMLRGIAKEGAFLIRGIEGIEECLLRFREGRPEYLLAADRERSASGMVDLMSIAERTRNSLFGPVVTKFIDGDREVDVRVRLKESDRGTVEKLLAGDIINEDGRAIPFRDLVKLSEGEGSTRIFRLNGRRSVTITAKIGSLSFQEGEYRIRKVLESMKLPDEYSFMFDSRLSEFRKERMELAAAVLLSVLLIYMILASQFESLKLPLLVMITIPLGAAGAVPALFLTRTPLSPPVYLGFIVLSGIVVNNGIILVDLINSRLRDRVPDDDGPAKIIRETSIEKIPPVIITSVVTILGMAPMLVNSGEGSSLWRPFALTVISGLLLSTLLTLIVLPVISQNFFRGGVTK